MTAWSGEDGRSSEAPPLAEQGIVLRNHPSELARFDALLSQFPSDKLLSEEQLFAIRLCAHEAITNIISYAFADHREHSIDVRVTVFAKEIRLTIYDDGRPFDPIEAPAPDVGNGARDPQIGGYGIHLIRNFSKAMHYKRVENKNRLTVVLPRDNNAPGPA